MSIVNPWLGRLAFSIPGTWAIEDVAVSGTTAAYWASNITSKLATAVHTPHSVLFNIGANDLGTGVTEAAWIANVGAVIDAVAAKWPGVLFYIMRPWKRGQDAAADTMAGWINSVVAAKATARLGPDERVWLKNGDDGVTYSGDGIHYNNAGETVCAAQWKSTLGL